VLCGPIRLSGLCVSRSFHTAGTTNTAQGRKCPPSGGVHGQRPAPPGVGARGDGVCLALAGVKKTKHLCPDPSHWSHLDEFDIDHVTCAARAEPC
jgi:hypothetical protein